MARQADVNGGFCNVAYLNPAGWINDQELGNAAGRLFLHRFRPSLTRAGFEVIDCPTLTLGQKNAADIRIVIDVLSTLDSDAPFDEFVIASSDADFTPLLHRLRAYDRRIVVVSAGKAALSYHSVADQFMGPEVLISTLLDDADDPGPTITSRTHTSSTEACPSTRKAAERWVSDRLAQCEAPLYLSQVGNLLRSEMGDAVDQTSWFGHGGLTAFLRNMDDGRLGVDNRFVWDPDHHEAPDDDAGARQSVLPSVVQDLRAATDLPALPSAAWPPLFAALADYAQRGQFTLTACTTSVRDTLKNTDTPVPRGAVSSVVRNLSWQRVRLDADPPPSADTMREAFRAGIIDRYEASGLLLGDTETRMLDRWLRGQGGATPHA